MKEGGGREGEGRGERGEGRREGEREREREEGRGERERERKRERERLQAVSQITASHCYSLVSEYYKPRVTSYSTLSSNL